MSWREKGETAGHDAWQEKKIGMDAKPLVKSFLLQIRRVVPISVLHLIGEGRNVRQKEKEGTSGGRRRRRRKSRDEWRGG